MNPPVPPPYSPSVLQQIIEGSGLLAKPIDVEGDDSYEQFVIIPEGLKLESLEPLRTTPRRVKQRESLADSASFIAYVIRFKLGSTIIRAERGSNEQVARTGELGTITAVIDYHWPTPEWQPGWGQHTAVFTVRLNRRFAAWLENNTKPMAQTSFAEWLDDRILDITSPPGAEMVEMVQWLEATSNASFKQVINLANGRTNFAFSDPMKLEVKGTEAELPRVMGLSLPIIEGGEDAVVNVQLRYRLESDRLRLFYRIPNIQDLLDKMWLELTQKVEKTLALPFYRVK